MTCQTVIAHTHQTHVAPIDARGHWRSYYDFSATCERPATAHVHVQYADGQVVERSLCAECLAEWQHSVAEIEGRRDIPMLGIMHPKAVWTVTAVSNA